MVDNKNDNEQYVTMAMSNIMMYQWKSTIKMKWTIHDFHIVLHDNAKKQ